MIKLTEKQQRELVLKATNDLEMATRLHDTSYLDSPKEDRDIMLECYIAGATRMLQEIMEKNDNPI